MTCSSVCKTGHVNFIVPVLARNGKPKVLAQHVADNQAA